MGGDVSSSVFVTLGWSSAERELPLRLTQSASVFFFVCFRLRLPPISSISVFVYLRLPTFSSAYVVIYLRFRLSLSQCHVVVPEGVDCVSGDLHSRVWKPWRCVCVCVNGVCGISHGKSKGLCCVVMYSITYRPLRSFGHLLISTH